MGSDDRFSAVKTDTCSPGLNTLLEAWCCDGFTLVVMGFRSSRIYPNSCSFHLAKGLKLLGLCPAYDEDESDDGSGKDMTTTEAT
jgi:hypothetical protein